MAKKKPKRKKGLKITSGPVQRELTPQEVLRIRRVWTALGKMTGAKSLEEFELGFMRDCDASKEIFVWEGIMVCCLLTQARSRTYLTDYTSKMIVNFFVGRTAGIYPSHLLEPAVLETADGVWEDLHRGEKSMEELFAEIKRSGDGQEEEAN